MDVLDRAAGGDRGVSGRRDSVPGSVGSDRHLVQSAGGQGESRARDPPSTDAGRTQVPITVTAADSAAIATFEHGALPASTLLPAVVLVRPDAPLPPAAEIGLEVLAAEVAAEGPLPMAKPIKTSLRTRGPLRLPPRRRPRPPTSRSSSRLPSSPTSLLPLLRLEGPALRASAPPPVTYGGRQATARVNLGVQLLPGKALTTSSGRSSAIASGRPSARRVARDHRARSCARAPNRADERHDRSPGPKRQALAQAINIEHVTVRAAARPPSGPPISSGGRG